MKPGEAALYLIPVPLGERASLSSLPPEVYEALCHIELFAVERIRTARRYIRKIAAEKPLDALQFFPLDKRSSQAEIQAILEPITRGKSVGLLSEAGLPAIADPGAQLVASAHEKGLKVIPLTGPSSLFLSLMASGMNGQQFTFNGYLPIQQSARAAAIKTLESRSEKETSTQIFIETPFRNTALFEALLKHCKPTTHLCIASDLSLPTAQIQTLRIAAWRRRPPQLHKRPSVFCLFATPYKSTLRGNHIAGAR